MSIVINKVNLLVINRCNPYLGCHPESWCAAIKTIPVSLSKIPTRKIQNIIVTEIRWANFLHHFLRLTTSPWLQDSRSLQKVKWKLTKSIANCYSVNHKLKILINLRFKPAVIKMLNHSKKLNLGTIKKIISHRFKILA